MRLIVALALVFWGPLSFAAIAVEQVADSSNGDFSLTGVGSGNTLIVIGTIISTAGDEVASSSSNVDGSFTTVKTKLQHGSGQSDGFYVTVLHDVTSGSHTITYTGTGTGSDTDSAIVEVSGWGSAPTLQDDNDFTATTTDTIATGDVTVGGEALLLVLSSEDGSSATTPNASWTEIFDGSREFAQYRVVTSSGTYDGDYTLNTNRTLGGIIVAIGVDAAGSVVPIIVQQH